MAETPSRGGRSLPMTPAQVGAWRARLEASAEALKPRMEQGKTNVTRYKGRHLSVTPGDDTVVVPADFWYAEQKKAQLFYRTPTVDLKPEQPGLEDAVLLFQPVLNYKLGHKGVNAKALMDQVIADVVVATGYGVAKIGYEATVDGTVEVQVGEEPDLTQMMPGSVLGLGPVPMKPIFEKAPRIIHERYFAKRISPAKLRLPPDFTGTDYDEADWIAYEYFEDVPLDASGAPRSVKGSHAADEDRLTAVPDSTGRAIPLRRKCCEVWYKAAKFDPAEKHPLKVRTFTLKEGDDAPAVHRDSPFQRFDPMTGQMVVGLTGFPIKVLTIRYISDDLFPLSDSSHARQQIDELSKGRTQQIQRRNRALPQILIDTTRLDTTTQAKIERNENTGLVGVNGPVDGIAQALDKGQFGRENFTFNDYIQQDLDKTYALGANQQGVTSNTGRTATELKLVQHNSDTRLGAERQRVVDWFVQKIAEPLGTLIQMFADQQEYVEILGANAQRLSPLVPQQPLSDGNVLAAWDKTKVQGRFAYSARANSAAPTDATEEKQNIAEWINFSAKSPYVNQAENWKEAAAAWGFDPARIIVQPEPPKAQPPNLSLSLKGEDLLNPIVLDLLQKHGLQIDPQAVQLALAQQHQAAQLAAQAGAGSGDPAPRPGNQLTSGTQPDADRLTKRMGSGELPGGGAEVAEAVR